MKKTIIFFLLIGIYFNFSCQEENDYQEVDMTGSWEITDYFLNQYVGSVPFKKDSFFKAGRFDFEPNGTGVKFLKNKTTLINKWSKEQYIGRITEDGQEEVKFNILTDLPNEQVWKGNTITFDTTNSVIRKVTLEHIFYLKRKEEI